MVKKAFRKKVKRAEVRKGRKKEKRSLKKEMRKQKKSARRDGNLRMKKKASAHPRGFIKKKASAKKMVLKKVLKKKVVLKVSVKHREEKKKTEVKKKGLREVYKRREEMFESAVGRGRLIEMGGENTITVLQEFSKDVSDEELSKKTKIKVSEVRAVLNRLHSAGFVEYAREKDPSSGWYSYIWKLKEDAVERFLKYCKEEEGLVKRAVNEGSEEYVCRACGVKSVVPFEAAFENQFACRCCGGKMEFLEEVEKKKILGK